MTDVVDAWLGSGPPFPFRSDPAGRITLVGGMQLIRQSIAVILDTEPGERIMLPSFGCGLRRYLMEPNSLTIRTAMAEDIASAIGLWEPRVRLLNVAVTPGQDPSLVWIDISYERTADRRQDNLVFPFYLK